MTNKKADEPCCPEFRTKQWDRKTFNWKQKKFIKDSLPTFFHIPYPPMISQKITRMYQAMDETAGAAPKKEDTLILFRDPSAFRSEIYLSVAKEVPGENNVNISGEFAARVFDGDYNAVPKFIKEMEKYLTELGKKAKDYYVHYAYCPGCAKKFGHNYMIIFAQV